MPCMSYRSLVLLLVFAAYFIDNVLMTVLVPIISQVLYDQIDLENSTAPTWQKREEENGKIGMLFAAKPITQLIANPIVGSLVTRYGRKRFMLLGSCFFLIAASVFAATSVYPWMVIARCIHGLGSSCALIAGMALLSAEYPDDDERSRATGMALGGMAAGVLLGYPLGGFTFAYVGKTFPFLVVILITIPTLCTQLCCLTEAAPRRCLTGRFVIGELLRDKPIAISLISIGLSTVSIATLEACLPIWLRQTLKVSEWQLGTVFIPDSIGYLIGTNVVGHWALRIGRWKCAIMSMFGIGIALFMVPMASKIGHLVIPHFIIGLGVATVDAALLPLLAFCVDVNHQGMYGAVFGLSQTTVSLAYALGPFVGGWLLEVVGFKALIRGLALITVLYAPANLLLKSYDQKDEAVHLLSMESSVDFESFSRRASQADCVDQE